MPFIPVPNTVELVATFRNTVNFNNVKNVINWKKRSGAVVAADLDVISGYYATWWQAAGNDHVSNQISLVQIDMRDLSSEASYVEVNPIASPPLGALGGAVMPMSVTMAVKFTTGLAGRSYRGRLYFVGLAETEVVGDFVNATAAEAIRVAYDGLRTGAFAATGYDMVVVSRYHNKAPRETGIASVITGVSLTDTRVDTQRRRLIGEGE